MSANHGCGIATTAATLLAESTLFRTPTAGAEIRDKHTRKILADLHAQMILGGLIMAHYESLDHAYLSLIHQGMHAYIEDMAEAA